MTLHVDEENIGFPSISIGSTVNFIVTISMIQEILSILLERPSSVGDSVNENNWFVSVRKFYLKENH